MADSKRQKLVDAIVTRLSAILVAGGYETNLGQNVFEWETHMQEEDIPAAGALSVCDLPASAAPTDGKSDPRHTIWQMPVHVRIFLPKNRLNADNVRKAIKDVNRAIRQDDRWKVANVGLAMISRPQSEGPVVPEDTFQITGGFVQFEVQYLTQKFNSEE